MTDTAPLLRLEGVARRFRRVQALDGVDLSVGAGGIFGLVGPNGAGKTTLFSVLCGFLHADRGVVEVAGHRVSPSSPPPPGLVSLLPQDARMMDRVPVGRQLVYWGRLAGKDAAAAEADARRVLAAVGLAEVWGRGPETLSHGMAKRVGVAQAFLGEPRLVVLDEPTAGLDPHAAREVKALLRALRGDRTIVVSSHNLAEIEDLCHEVAILHRGRVVRHDAVEVLVGSAEEIAFRLPRAPEGAWLAALRAVPFVSAVTWDPAAERLRVAFDPGRKPPPEAARDLVAAFVELRIPFVEMQLGKSLEDRFLEETKA